MQRYDCTPEVGCVRQRGAYLSDAEIYTNVYVDYTDEYKGVSRPVFEKNCHGFEVCEAAQALDWYL